MVSTLYYGSLTYRVYVIFKHICIYKLSKKQIGKSKFIDPSMFDHQKLADLPVCLFVGDNF